MNEYTPTLAQVRDFWASDGNLQPAAKSHEYGEGCTEFDRFIADVKADERQSLLEELTADAEHEARIGEQGNDSERVNAAEKIIEMLNDVQIEREA